MISLDQVDFGHNSAKHDPKLIRYFFKRGVTEKVLKNEVTFLLGKKGSGKSAVAHYFKSTIKSDWFCEVIDHSSASLQEFGKLADSSLTGPAAYIYAWQYLLLCRVAQLMIQDPEIMAQEAGKQLQFFLIANFGNQSIGYEELLAHTKARRTVVKIPKKLIQIEQEITSRSTKGETINFIKYVPELMTYLKKIKTTNHFFVFLDELDQGYNDVDGYSDIIVALFKAVFALRAELRQLISGIHFVPLLRTDIFDELRDHDRNKWGDDIHIIDWVDSGRRHGLSDLQIMISRRVNISVGYEKRTPSWNDVFGITLPMYGRVSAYQYMLTRTLHRPRDLIEFAKCCQRVAHKGEVVTQEIIREAEGKYSDWLRREFIDEIYKRNPEVSKLFDIFRRMRSDGRFSLAEFEVTKNQISSLRKVDSRQILAEAFTVGIIGNFRRGYRREKDQYIWKWRNPDAEPDFSSTFIVHTGLFAWCQLY